MRDLATHFATRAGVVKAVDGVSFDVRAGEIVGLVGESGSGKSVTGYSILGLIDPPGRIVGGSIKLDGQELVGLSHDRCGRLRGRRIAMVFQDPMSTLNPVLKVSDPDATGAAGPWQPRHRARCGDAVSRRSPRSAFPTRSAGSMPIRTSSRAACASASRSPSRFCNQPGLVICDEPTTALDVSIQAQILAEMKALVREAGVSLIWISHDLATVSARLAAALVMYAGRMIEEGPTAAVLRRPRHPYTQGLIDSLPSRAPPGRDLDPDSRCNAVADCAAFRLRVQAALHACNQRLRCAAR